MKASRLTIRRAAVGDLAAIVAMLADDHLGRSREVVSLPVAECYSRAFEEIDADPSQLLLVGEAGDPPTVIATLQLSFIRGLSHRGTRIGQIEAVRVGSSHRGRGFGHQLVLRAIEECGRRGCGLVQLASHTTRSDARRFYESLGFTATHVGMKLPI